MRTECEIRSTSTHTAGTCNQSAGIYVLILSMLTNLGHFQHSRQRKFKNFPGGAAACLWRSIGQNGENVLISDFQVLASMSLVYRAVDLGITSSSLIYRAVHLGIPSSSLVYRAVHLGITSSCSVKTEIKCKR